VTDCQETGIGFGPSARNENRTFLAPFFYRFMTSQIILAKVSAIHTTTADCGSHKERDGSE